MSDSPDAGAGMPEPTDAMVKAGMGALVSVAGLGSLNEVPMGKLVEAVWKAMLASSPENSPGVRGGMVSAAFTRNLIRDAYIRGIEMGQSGEKITLFAGKYADDVMKRISPPPSAPSPSGARTPEKATLLKAADMLVTAWAEKMAATSSVEEIAEIQVFNAEQIRAMANQLRDMADVSGAGARTDSPKDWRECPRVKAARVALFRPILYPDMTDPGYDLSGLCDALCDAVAACSRSGEVSRG